MRLGLCFWPVQALGPGKRYGIWLQGCSRNCPACMARSFQPMYSGRSIVISCEDILDDIMNCGATAVTISGGEPFEQADELHKLLGLLTTTGLHDIIIYSGYLGEYLINRYPWLPELASCLIDGPFLKNMPTEAAWKGSENQRAWIFKALPGYDEWLKESKGRLQMAWAAQNLYILGIPRVYDAPKLLGKMDGND